MVKRIEVGVVSGAESAMISQRAGARIAHWSDFPTQLHRLGAAADALARGLPGRLLPRATMLRWNNAGERHDELF